MKMPEAVELCSAIVSDFGDWRVLNENEQSLNERTLT